MCSTWSLASITLRRCRASQPASRDGDMPRGGGRLLVTVRSSPRAAPGIGGCHPGHDTERNEQAVLEAEHHLADSGQTTNSGSLESSVLLNVATRLVADIPNELGHAVTVHLTNR
jgi:hypothetical protein